MPDNGFHKTIFLNRTAAANDQVLQPGLGTLMNMERALAFCLALIECVAQAHGKTGMHSAICHANIRLDADGSPGLRKDASLPPAYVSPEQTGRMNREVDYRSDYYSTGIVIYELFTGHLPFESDNAMELVHSHIARKPVPPIQLNPEIPQPLSDIIMKLLSKNAEDRYQSLEGLRADLQVCRTALLENGIIPAFEPGRQDICDRLRMPQKLYGREGEVAQLMEAFNRTAAGSVELLLVTGYSGSGKSSLVNELHKPVVAGRGYFVSGKFDQFKRNVPYFAIAQAFRELIRQILTESETRIAGWKVRILDALGPNGQLMIDAIPALEYIIGKQPEVPQLAPAEAQNRFNYVLQNFVNVFTRLQHPLVIFLDDLQWADDASLKLIHLFMTALEQPSLLLIATYRDNEVEAADPLMLTIGAIEKQARVSAIAVKALTEQNVVALLADTVRSSEALAGPLASLIYRKTLGNPFFVGQFIKNLYNEKLLGFADGQWNWNIGQIEAMAITDNVIELLTGELERLPGATRHLLTLAACIGNRFDLKTLATVAEHSAEETQILLQPALQAGLVMSSDTCCGGAENAVLAWRFLHDRVQQAAYGGIPEGQRKAIHLQIGRLLFSSIPGKHRDERLFDIVLQLNEGKELLDDRREIFELAELNLQAARKAKSTVAYKAVLKHASAGISLLQRVGGSASPLYFSLQLEQMDASFLSHQFGEVERLGKSILAYAADNFQRALVMDVLIQSCLYQDRHVDALPLAFSTLRLLGVELPETAGRAQIPIRILKIKLLFGLRAKSFLTAPLQKDPVENLKQQVMTRAVAACYIANPAITPVFVLERVYMNLKSGCYSSWLPISLVGYAMLLIQRSGAMRQANTLGQMALALANRANFPGQKNTPDIRVNFAVYGFILHWREHLSSTVSPLYENYQAGLQIGEFEYAVYSLLTALRAELIVGRPLPALLEKMQLGLNKANNLKQKTSLDALRVNIKFVSALTGPDAGEEEENNWIDSKNITRLTSFLLHLFESIKAWLFSDFEEALTQIEKCALYLKSASCMATLPVYHLFHSLCLLACYPGMDGKRRRQALEKINVLQKTLKLWADHAPMNNLHKWQLVEAERCRIAGEHDMAARYFDLARDGARDNGFLSEEALSNELAARFYLAADRQAGSQLRARMYMEEAHVKYVEWGARAKVLRLEMQYPDLLSRVIDLGYRNAVRETPPSEQRFDVQTIIRASQTLSGEIQLGKLLQKLMRLLIENAGAQKGVLLWKKEGVLTVQARAQEDVIEVQQDTPIEEDTDLSLAILYYVNHTCEKVVLGDAGKASQFSSDPYIQRERPKSVLCIPLKKQSELAGILYLENRLAIDAFTHEHIELLEILSTQIAISLENAELYNKLEQKIQERTHALSQKNGELNQTLISLRQMQKQLVESEKLASLGQLVAGVAHEINTPVGVGVTGASTLEEETARFYALYRDGTMKRSDLDSYVNTAATISKLLLSNMERAATLIQSFKEVAIDQTSEERRRFGLKSYIEDVLQNLGPALRRSERKVSVECADTIEVDTYPGALSQILTNFVMNALLHAFTGGEHGTMSIVVREPDPDSVELCFSDTGKGIPEENLPKIFNPFFTTLRGRGGSGLGLNIVHNLVTGRLQGQIAVESKLNVGTKFTINFPRNCRLG